MEISFFSKRKVSDLDFASQLCNVSLAITSSSNFYIYWSMVRIQKKHFANTLSFGLFYDNNLSQNPNHSTSTSTVRCCIYHKDHIPNTRYFFEVSYLSSI